jgi:hypothetical protein
MTTSSFPRDCAAARRLNGWKEIAAHLDKGVRTVQPPSTVNSIYGLTVSS